MAKKCLVRKVKVSGHWKLDGILPKYVSEYTKEICIPIKRGVKRRARR